MTSTEAHAIALIGAAARTALGEGIGFFQHGSVLQNSLSSNEATPQVFLFDPRPKQDTQATNAVKLDCTISFLDAEPGDGDSPAQSEATILRMGELKDRFLEYLDRNPRLEMEGLQWESERLLYSGRFTGVVLKFQLKLPVQSNAAACVPEVV